MKQTGNHATINWVKSQHTGEVGFIAETSPIIKNQINYRTLIHQLSIPTPYSLFSGEV